MDNIKLLIHNIVTFFSLILFFDFISKYTILIWEFTKIKKQKYQYLLENPKKFIFDSKYLDSITYSSSPLIKCLDEYCQSHSIYSTGAIVSLSGGVDSMVILAILIYLQKIYKFPIFTASIDYGLREESEDESEFLIKYTKMFGIKSYVSYIEGISRKKEDSCSRSEFEEESRFLRFNTYRKIIDENKLTSNCGIFVGHHQDDTIENIFTNSMKGGNLLDLEVMKSESKIHGVKIYRPFLGFRKSVIYEFAHKYDVPYFLDTTPKWSRRGKMRNEIFPLLDSVFGIDWRNKLKLLGDQSNEWNDYFSKYVIDPWMEDITIGSRGIIIPIKKQPKLIYSHVLLKSLHKSGESMIRRTSIDKIMELITKKQSDKVITLDGTRMATLIKNNDYLMIFNTNFIKKVDDSDISDMYIQFINGYKVLGLKKYLPTYLHKYIKSH